MQNTIYHNPNWSKSRKSIEILDNQGIDYNIIYYLKQPLSFSELKLVFTKLKIHPSEALRKNERDYKLNNINLFIKDSDVLIEKMIKYPKIIERPIIIIGDNAVIGRPPENILNLLNVLWHLSH